MPRFEDIIIFFMPVTILMLSLLSLHVHDGNAHNAIVVIMGVLFVVQVAGGLFMLTRAGGK